jgi:hypothetical protein
MQNKKLKINKIKPNPNNPRLIKDHKFKQLVKSIKEFPEMLQIREIVVDEDMIILGGNMRYKACVEAGLKEVDVVIMEGLTPKQKEEFVIKDNANYGIWDWEMLANNFDPAALNDWGLNVWQPSLSALIPEKPIEDTNDEDDASVSSDGETAEEGTGGRKIIQIEFKIEDYPVAFELYQEMKAKKIDIGLILINKLKEELCK